MRRIEATPPKAFIDKVERDVADAHTRYMRRRRRADLIARGLYLLPVVIVLALLLLMSAGCASRQIDYDREDGFSYSNTGFDTNFGALDVQRRITTETIDPATGAVIERVTEETVVNVEAYQGADAVARALGQAAEALKEVASSVPGG